MPNVRATRTGYYDHKRRREGEEFFMDDKSAYRPERDELTGKPTKGMRLTSWIELIDEDEKPHRRQGSGATGGVKKVLPNPPPHEDVKVPESLKTVNPQDQTVI